MSSHSYRGMSANGVMAMGIVLTRYPNASVCASIGGLYHVSSFTGYYGPSTRTHEDAWIAASVEVKEGGHGP